MDDLITYGLALAKEHGPLAAALAVLGYVGRGHMKSDDGKHADFELRMRLLEAERVTKADVRAVHQRIDDLGTQLATGQREILLAIANRGPVK